MICVPRCTDSDEISFVWVTSSNEKTFPRYRPFVRGIHRSPVNSPHKGQWHGALMFLWSAPEQTVEEIIETPMFAFLNDGVFPSHECLSPCILQSFLYNIYTHTHTYIYIERETYIHVPATNKWVFHANLDFTSQNRADTHWLTMLRFFYTNPSIIRHCNKLVVTADYIFETWDCLNCILVCFWCHHQCSAV